ncbi:MAG: hypothetical protein AN487_22685 [Anabaena sp. CRKS33]|nr:MAG: hypothetical protein AN487_22685 [Anabaena sp. CRKS33]
MQRHALAAGPLGFPATSHHEIGFAVKPIYPLVIDAPELRTQQVMDAPVAKSASLMRDLHDPDTQGLGGCIDDGRMTIAIPG